MPASEYNRDPRLPDASRTTLTSAEVCEMFNIPRSTLHRWLKAGKIPEPAMNPTSKQLVWTQTEINAISKFLMRGQAE